MTITSTNITIGRSTTETPLWLKEMLEYGQKPGFLFFTRKEILTKGVIPEEEIGEGYKWGGEEYYYAPDVCQREVEIISTWNPESELPIIQDEEIILKHLQVMNLQLFKVGHPQVHFRDVRGRAFQLIFTILKDKDGKATIHRLTKLSLLNHFQRLTPMWIVGSHNLQKMREYVVYSEARKVMFSIIALLYPELELTSSQGWRRLGLRRLELLNMEEFKPSMQEEIRAALIVQNPPRKDQQQAS